jgi:hypothetical protein
VHANLHPKRLVETWNKAIAWWYSQLSQFQQHDPILRSLKI